MRAWRGARARRRNPLTCAEGGMQLLPACLRCAGNVGASVATAGARGAGRGRRLLFIFLRRFRTPLADPMASLFGSNRMLRGAQGSWRAGLSPPPYPCAVRDAVLPGGVNAVAPRTRGTQPTRTSSGGVAEHASALHTCVPFGSRRARWRGLTLTLTRARVRVRGQGPGQGQGWGCLQVVVGRAQHVCRLLHLDRLHLDLVRVGVRVRVRVHLMCG